MTARLSSITISNFRSINSDIMVPLDAPVVIIHGPNGTGKTSVLSAIELALTGDVIALKRVDPDFKKHLVYKGATSADLRIKATGLDNSTGETAISVRDGVITGRPLLTTDLAKVYSERCYLAQASLGKLLELYQGQSAERSSSPLTSFVKELLGLDVLESIIDGLHDAGDIRRVRNLVPAYSDTELRISDAQRKVERASEMLRTMVKKQDDLVQQIRAMLEEAGVNSVTPLAPLELIQDLLLGELENPRSMVVARVRRDLLALKEQFESLQMSSGVIERISAEADHFARQQELARWKEGAGQTLSETISQLREEFPNLPSLESGSPDVASTTALRVVEAEINRISNVLDRQEQIANSINTITEELERLQGRIQRLDEQISQHAVDAGSFARALSGILPHITSEDCPVCGRDYRELGNGTLATSVSAKISTLTESAGMLEALSREKNTALTRVAQIVKEKDQLTSGQSPLIELEEAKARRGSLQVSEQVLQRLLPEAARATEIFREADASARQVTVSRQATDQVSYLIDSAAGAAMQLGASFEYPTTSLASEITRLLELAESEERSLEKRKSASQSAMSILQSLRSGEDAKAVLHSEETAAREELQRLGSIKKSADLTIETARTLSKDVLEVRTSIVRRVFNETLNRLWADLFKRLAPDENFVPAFSVPEKISGPVEAELETIHRKGQRAGNPQTMLSAGNLNTAALTLFLALHLSLAPKLPWLLIDDPVQSMDEVHISQFAALLRTLSKQADRQVVIAVHERPLFEYLALELSPAFPEDKLITVEISRNAVGETVAKAKHHVWQEDQTFLIA